MADVIPEEKHPEIVGKVLAEVKALGEDSKQNYEKICGEVKDLRKQLEEAEGKTDPLIQTHIEKLESAITVRQDELDKKNTKRIDDIELALQRIPEGTSESKADRFEAARQFKQESLILKRDLPTNGVIPDESVSVEALAAYEKAFGPMLRRYIEKNVPNGNIGEENFKAMEVGIDPEGGYLVTPAISNRIIARVYESDPIRQLASIETISTDSIKFSVDRNQAGYGWVGERTARTVTDTPQIGEKEVFVHEMYALPEATQKLLDDSAINIETYLANKVAQRFARVEAAAFVSGTGILQPRGFLTYASGTSWGQIEQTPMLGASTLTTDGLINVLYSLVEEYLMRGVWVMNRLTVRDVMKLKDGDGQYIWRPGISEKAPSTLLGYPLRMSTTMPTVAASALAIAIADWAEAYVIVDRLGISVLRDPYSNKPYVQFYFRRRVGGDVLNYDAIKLGVVSAT